MPATTNSTEITGQFAGEQVRREDWVIGTLADGTKIRGIAEPSSLKRGDWYKFFGEIETHPRFGDQFAFSGFIESTPADAAGIIEYLTRNCVGIGNGIARQLYDSFGAEAVERLRTNPEACVEEVPRLTLDVAAQASDTLKGIAKHESAKIELIGLFQGRYFPKNAIDQSIKRWGPSASRLIRKNPYLTMQLKGVGFTKADQLYLDLGGSKDRLKRQTLCVAHFLETDTEGHTWFPASKIVDHLRSEIGGARANATKALRLGLRAKLLATCQDEKGGVWYTAADRAAAEATITRKLVELQDAECRWPFDISGISDHQSAGLYNSTLGPVGLLIGSPGTGKTYTVAALVRRILAVDSAAKGIDEINAEIVERQKAAIESNDYFAFESIRRNVMVKYRPIYVAAPTGKAAVRATEAMANSGLSLKARTIHGTLGVELDHDGGFCFRHHAGNPLPVGWLIVDESSMLSCDLAASLLSACPIGMHILFVGDIHQLSPVGYGAPLRDMISAGLPTGTLSEIQRNAGTIVRTCAAIKDGGAYRADKELVLPESNLIHAQANKDDVQVELLKSTLAQLKKTGVDLLRDVQILVTINRKSAVSRIELNKILHPILNPNPLPFEKAKFKVGDKVICTKNQTFTVVGQDMEDDNEDWP